MDVNIFSAILAILQAAPQAISEIVGGVEGIAVAIETAIKQTPGTAAHTAAVGKIAEAAKAVSQPAATTAAHEGCAISEIVMDTPGL